MDYQDFKVLWVENKNTKDNRPFKAINIENSVGTKTDVNIFSNFPDFANIRPGSSINGRLEKKGEYWNIISSTQDKPRGGANSGYKEKVIGEAMHRKEVSIGKFQDNKDFSIMVSSTMRDAVLLAIAELGNSGTNDNAIRGTVLKWRQWLLDNWEVDPKDIKPF